MSGKPRPNDNNRERRGYYSKRNRGSNFKRYNKGRPTQGFDEHGDIVMSDTGNRSLPRRYLPYSGSGNDRGMRGRMRGKGGTRFHRVVDRSKSNRTWAKVTIPYGKKVEKAYILRNLTALSEKPFIPVNYHLEGNAVVFFVEDLECGLALCKYSRKISTPDGFKLLINTSASTAPMIQLDKDIVDKIKVCMSSRYDPQSKRLNLSKFHLDHELKASGIYAPLHRLQVLHCVANVIVKDIKELSAIDLSGNRLVTLEPLKNVMKEHENVIEINLYDNIIRTVAELDHIKSNSVLTFTLDRNPLCDAHKTKSTYISMVRKRFPKVINLDGQELPPLIAFEIEKEIKLPSSQGSFFMNEECKQLIGVFLDQYYTIYDSENRQALLPAYADDAIMSLSINRPSSGPLIEYQKQSRNLLRVDDSERRMKLLKQNRLSVVSFLSELPRSQHDRNSFTVDVTFISPQMISFSVCGLFKEFDKEVDVPQKSPIRSFCRTFVVVPQGSGISIINEMLVISNPTAEQIRSAFKGPAPTPSPSPVPSTSSIPPAIQAVDPRQQMIAAFSEKSGMNFDFSSKCLAENEWNFDKAAHTFLELKKRGVIPAEAFLK